jgi:hypothetical protein
VTIQIFGNADIAVALGVTRPAFSNWLSRHKDTVPVPFATTPDGRLYWDMDGLREWMAWKERPREKFGEHAAEQRRREVMSTVVEQLRKDTS